MSMISNKVYRPYDPHSFDNWTPFYNFHHGGGTVVEQHSSAFSNGETRPFNNGVVESKETAETHELKAHLPGFKKEELKVEIEEGNVLCITGEKKIEKEENDAYFYRFERSSERFVKSFQLPERVKVDQVTAYMENGVLTITIPREKKLTSNSRPTRIF